MSQSFPMSATLTTRSQIFVACPHCGDTEHYQIDHLLSMAHDQDFGWWECSSCGWNIRGTVTVATQTVTITEMKEPDRVVGYVLLRVHQPTENKPIWIIIKHKAFVQNTMDEMVDHMYYFFDEGQCPTNFIPVEAVVHDGDMDPHGIFQFEAFVPIPPNWTEEDEHADRWAELFPQLVSDGPEIDGVVDTGTTTQLMVPNTKRTI